MFNDKQLFYKGKYKMYCKISRFLIFLLLFTIANAFADELNTDLWASKTGWQTKGSTLSAVSTEISTLGLKRNLRAENIEFRAKITPCKAIANGKIYKYVGIRLQEKADKFWQLALTEGPNIGNETGKRSIGLHEKFGNVWGAENKYKFKRIAYQSGTWKYGETYELILRMNLEMVEGIVTDASGKQITHIAYRIQEKFVLKASPVLVVKRMQVGFGTLSCKIQDAKDTSLESTEFLTVKSRSLCLLI
jgi:hypothetical protein